MPAREVLDLSFAVSLDVKCWYLAFNGVYMQHFVNRTLQYDAYYSERDRRHAAALENSADEGAACV